MRVLDAMQIPVRVVCHPKACVFGLATALLVSVGCGGSADKSKFKPFERGTASGAVTLDGKPVPAGSISFRHKDSGNRAVCQIKDGSFASASGQGPQLGVNVAEVFGRETNDPYAPYLWGGSFTQEVTIEKSGFKGDFAVTKDKVKPPPPPPKKDDGK